MPRFSAYPLFPTIAAARAKFRRHRNPTTFILEGSTSELKRVKCVDCGRPLSDFSGVDEDGKDLHPDGYRGNRCDYIPATKSVRAHHYVCAWTGTLKAVARVRAA